MSITIYRSTSDYSSVNEQIILNELGELWDTENWKNAGGQSVVKASGTDNVERLYISDKIYIGLNSSSRLTITHTNGASSTVSSAITTAFIIVKTDTALLFDVPSTAICFAVGPVVGTDENSFGCIIKTATSAAGYCYTDNATTDITTSSYTATMTVSSSDYTTQLIPICSATCGDIFDDVFLVRMCPSGLTGKCTISGQTYYLSHYQNNGVIALKYSE